MSGFQIGVIVGSLRRDSFNRQLATALAQFASKDFTFKQLEIGDLPLYNQDDDANQAAPVKRLKAEIAASQGLLFVTAEYNRSIPGVLKNAIDHASRPYGKNGWAGKPGAIIGTTGGAVGTAAAQSHLRSIMSVLEVQLMTQPELYFVTRDGLINDDFDVTDEETRAFLQGWVDKFAGWVEKQKA